MRLFNNDEKRPASEEPNTDVGSHDDKKQKHDNAKPSPDSMPVPHDLAKNDKKQNFTSDACNFMIESALFHQTQTDFVDFNADGKFRSNASNWSEKTNKTWTNQFKQFVLRSTTELKIPSSIPSHTWMPNCKHQPKSLKRF